MMIDKFLDQYRNKSVHIVGGTGSEGSSILRLLSKNRFSDLFVHDFIEKEESEKSFKIWHKGLSSAERNVLFDKFQKDLKKIALAYTRDKLNTGLLAINTIKNIKV